MSAELATHRTAEAARWGDAMVGMAQSMTAIVRIVMRQMESGMSILAGAFG
jgi:hypothetical protein